MQVFGVRTHGGNPLSMIAHHAHTAPPHGQAFFRISASDGQWIFNAIRAVAAEVAAIVPHDHLDVCILQGGGRFHTAYETGIDTAWGKLTLAPVANSPIRSLLLGEVDHQITDDAMTDPRFVYDGAFCAPILDNELRSRLHVPMIVRGEIIGALSCSLKSPARYGPEDLRNARTSELRPPISFPARRRTGPAIGDCRGGSTSARGRLAPRGAAIDRGAGTGTPAHRHGPA